MTRKKQQVGYKIKEFEKENPQLAKALDIFDMSMKEYQRALDSANSVETFTNNSTITRAE